MSEVRPVTTILAVRDLRRSVAFYRAAFGWPVRIEVPVLVEFELPGGTGLSLYQREGFARNTGTEPALPPAQGTTGTELYLHCDELEALIERIRAAGGQVLTPLAPRSWGDEAAYFADPDGNVIAVGRPLPG